MEWRREKNWDPTFSTCRNEGAALAEASMEPGPASAGGEPRDRTHPMKVLHLSPTAILT
jgi:hypothetical protein